MFFKRLILKSPLSTEEIIRRLMKITNTGSNDSKYKSRFEGTVDHLDFQIYPTFNYQSMYRFRPQVNGILTKQENNSVNIDLTFTLSTGLKLFFITGIVLNILVMVYLIIEPSKNTFMFNWKFFAVFIPLMFCLFLADFNFKVNRSERLLRHRFRAVSELCRIPAHSFSIM